VLVVDLGTFCHQLESHLLLGPGTDCRNWSSYWERFTRKDRTPGKKKQNMVLSEIMVPQNATVAIVVAAAVGHHFLPWGLGSFGECSKLQTHQDPAYPADGS
jgi:hypothetical protein